MTTRSLFLFGGTTMLLWVVPSIGTQGMGTIGARVAHPDAMLFDAVPDRQASGRIALRRADETAETALGL